VSQLFICVCLSTSIPPGLFLVNSVIDEIAEIKGYSRLVFQKILTIQASNFDVLYCRRFVFRRSVRFNVLYFDVLLDSTFCKIRRFVIRRFAIRRFAIRCFEIRRFVIRRFVIRRFVAQSLVAGRREELHV
jgi:hypothetical protein